MNLVQAETDIATAIKDGFMTTYASDDPDEAAMQKVADAIAPGVVAALQHIIDNAETDVDAEGIL